MRFNIFVGAECAYACITHKELTMDVRLGPGRSAAQSLRETAEGWREKARRLQDRANILSVAAAQLEEDERAGRKYSSRP